MAHAMRLGEVPPVFKIDLSLPPSQRYIHVARKYHNHLVSITGLFDQLITDALPKSLLPWIKRLSRIFLRRLYTHEETEEIKGISRATGIELYLLVSFNVLLDLLMGCTSGAALTKLDNPAGGKSQPRLLHFRTLDWGMDELRKLLVCFEYVRGPDYETVLATNITYIGFVGVLTGVRRGLSVSLNFRPNHDTSSWLRNYRYYGSHLLVLLGMRRSVSSLLRRYIIPSDGLSPLPALDDVWPTVMRTPSTAAYLIFCDGVDAVVLEKDHRTAHVERQSSFIVATNSDHVTPSATENGHQDDHVGAALGTGVAVSVVDLIEDSEERRKFMQAHWDKKVRQARKAASIPKCTYSTARQDPMRRTRASQRMGGRSAHEIILNGSSLHTPSSGTLVDSQVTATLQEVIKWTATYPTTNEMTHFAAVMDPTEGKVVWIRRYLEPLVFDTHY
ncbi:beta subunit of N-acylethanolamine-hydrolyzing acid amidase-domain-containing protein [Aspergillus pseudonomiae]|uniref:ceramidase n=1 Tax=Aspergillus pseudonomiae TaxID=1506151 RepID=A0A5N7DL26_9EURO|nr:beta subunit of N-acylethanolamine-hydrolyzing acid amidase-domain-containing protein [Aspergillus pseudonomiae]KAB8262385.1 beta subunit of N-acylethanolamine-hydrolyzing acid amidase-domain-containing protein [Aspergillus pseudonomiae]KAE8407005.1 beta subunit of N-acylethanolamine-hydrolyzing acid amidase-domain-containing protein [Aspergillus pseudonomiae]